VCGAGFLACPSGRLESLPHNIEKILNDDKLPSTFRGRDLSLLDIAMTSGIRSRHYVQRSLR